MMGFQKHQVVPVSSKEMEKNSLKTFVLPVIPWPYYAMTIFMGMVAAFDLNVPTIVLLILSVVIFYVLLQKSLVQPVFGLIALVTFIPYSKAIAGNLGGMIPGMNYTTVLTIIALFGFFSNAKNTVKYGELPLEWWFRRILIVFCLFVAVAIFHTDLSDSSETFFTNLVDLKRWIDPLMVFFLTSYLVQEEEDAKKILYMMAFTLVIIGMGSFWQRHELDNYSHYVRLTGIAGQANTMGAFYANYSFVVIGFFFMKGMKLFPRGLFFFGIAGCLLGLFATESRGDALGLVGGILVFFFLKNKLQFLIIIALLTFAAVNPQFLPGGLKQRIERTVQHQSKDGFSENITLDPSARTRLVLWKGAIRMIEDNPIFGVGYKMFHSYIYGYVDHDESTANLDLKGRDGHNAYLMIGAEMGLPTLFIFLSILVFMFRIGFKSYHLSPNLYWRTVSIIALCSISSLTITNMFGSRVFSLILTGYLWILLAILLKMPRWAEQRRVNKGNTILENTVQKRTKPVFSRI